MLHHPQKSNNSTYVLDKTEALIHNTQRYSSKELLFEGLCNQFYLKHLDPWDVWLL